MLIVGPVIYVNPKALLINNANSFLKELKIGNKTQLNNTHRFTDTQKNKMAIRFL